MVMYKFTYCWLVVRLVPWLALALVDVMRPQCLSEMSQHQTSLLFADEFCVSLSWDPSHDSIFQVAVQTQPNTYNVKIHLLVSLLFLVW